MIVVSNTSPLCYLALIGHLDLLPMLFRHVTVPEAVRDELENEGAPPAVRDWISQPPAWIEIRAAMPKSDAALNRLHAGEREAIVLAETLGANLVILDEKAARQVAADRGLNVTGLLGILDEAATRGLVDLPAAVERLQRTTFRASPRLLKTLLDRHRKPASDEFVDKPAPL